MSIDAKANTGSGTRFPRFLQILRDDHCRFRWLLAIVREEQQSMAADRPVDLTTLQDVLRYLSEVPEQSHYPRKRHLVDRVTSSRESTRETLDPLLDDHDRLQAEGNRLYFRVVRAINGEDVGLRNLAGRLEDFVDAYEEHLQHEKATLFRHALELLQEEDWRSLIDGMSPVDDPLFGTRVRRRYRHLAKALEARLGQARRGPAIAGHLSPGAIIDKISVLSEAAAGLGVIVADHAAQSLRENLDVTRDRIRDGGFRSVPGLAAALNGNTIRHLASGFKEGRKLLARTIDDIRTPYNLQIEATEQTLGDDRDS